jgi:Histidine kinase-, DNA gyrase B-, and HSP90-like ATPase
MSCVSAIKPLRVISDTGRGATWLQTTNCFSTTGFLSATQAQSSLILRDAWATEVDIVWPERGDGAEFYIRDNGKGMTEAQFRRRWMTIDYNRLNEEGKASEPPEELVLLSQKVAGRRFRESIILRVHD